VNYRARIERAALLAEQHVFAREIPPSTAQSKISAGILRIPSQALGQEAVVPANGDLRSELNLPVLLDSFAEFSQDTRSARPKALVEEARNLKSKAPGGRRKSCRILEDRFAGNSSAGRPPAGTSVSQPFEDFSRGCVAALCGLRHRCNVPPTPVMTVCRCPLQCPARVRVLRRKAKAASAFSFVPSARSNGSSAYPLRQLREEKEQQTSCLRRQQFPHVRVESCETCKHYLRTIDLTKDGNAIPV